MSMHVQPDLIQISNKDTSLCLLAFLKLHIRTLYLPRQYSSTVLRQFVDHVVMLGYMMMLGLVRLDDVRLD